MFRFISQKQFSRALTDTDERALLMRALRAARLFLNILITACIGAIIVIPVDADFLILGRGIHLNILCLGFIFYIFRIDVGGDLKVLMAVDSLSREESDPKSSDSAETQAVLSDEE